MTHSDLVQRAARWLKNQKVSEWRCPIILTEYRSYAHEQPDVFGLAHQHTVLIECKASLADFRQDFKKNHRHYTYQLGTYRFYFCEDGLIPISELPDTWGLLYLRGKNVSVINRPLAHDLSLTRKEEYQILYSLVRRLTSNDRHDKTLKMLRG